MPSFNLKISNATNQNANVKYYCATESNRCAVVRYDCVAVRYHFTNVRYDCAAATNQCVSVRYDCATVKYYFANVTCHCVTVRCNCVTVSNLCVAVNNDFVAVRHINTKISAMKMPACNLRFGASGALPRWKGITEYKNITSRSKFSESPAFAKPLGRWAQASGQCGAKLLETN